MADDEDGFVNFMVKYLIYDDKHVTIPVVKLTYDTH